MSTSSTDPSVSAHSEPAVESSYLSPEEDSDEQQLTSPARTSFGVLQSWAREDPDLLPNSAMSVIDEMVASSSGRRPFRRRCPTDQWSLVYGYRQACIEQAGQRKAFRSLSEQDRASALATVGETAELRILEAFIKADSIPETWLRPDLEDLPDPGTTARLLRDLEAHQYEEDQQVQAALARHQRDLWHPPPPSADSQPRSQVTSGPTPLTAGSSETSGLPVAQPGRTQAQHTAPGAQQAAPASTGAVAGGRGLRPLDHAPGPSLASRPRSMAALLAKSTRCTPDGCGHD